MNILKDILRKRKLENKYVEDLIENNPDFNYFCHIIENLKGENLIDFIIDLCRSNQVLIHKINDIHYYASNNMNKEGTVLLGE